MIRLRKGTRISAQANDTQMEQIIIKALYGLLGTLLVRVTEWFLSHRSVSKRSKRIDALLNRIELVEKLRSIQESSSDSLRIEDIVKFCWDDIHQGFESLKPIEPRWPLVPGEGLPGWRRFLLMYKQPFLKGKVYRVFFYVFLCLALVVGATSAVLDAVTKTLGDWRYAVMGAAFYVGLGLLFRAAAVQTFKKVAKNLAANKSDTSA